MTALAPVSLASSPGSLLKNGRGGGGEGGESLVTSVGKVVDIWHLALAVPIRLQNETRVHMTFCTLSKKLSTRDELISADYTSKVDKKTVFGCAEGAQVQRVQGQSSL